MNPKILTSHKKNLARVWQMVVLAILIFLLAACKSNQDETPTPGLNQTQAYETVIAEVTAIAALTGTPTDAPPIPTESGLPSPTLEMTATPPPPTGVPSTITPTSPPTGSTCDRAEAGIPIDVTIPDDTQFAAGTAFVKTWRLVNVGTCTWTGGYALVYFSGEKMGGPDVTPLGGDVAPGQTVDLSVNLTAPSSAGTYQGNWMLKNPSGVLFGIGPQGNSFFWVRIVVPGEAGTSTITPTPTPTGSVTASGSETPTSSTPTITPTTAPTPVILVNSTIAFQPDGLIDLDTGTTNGSTSNDISYTTNQDGTHPLTPLGGATLGVFGAQPSYANCQAANLSGASIAVESLSAGTYLCYQTELGHYGWLRLDSYDANTLILSLTLLTWE